MNIENSTSRLVAPVKALNFLHQDTQIINKNMSAIQAYNMMTHQSSPWLNTAFKIRDFLSYKLAGIKPIKGFGSSKIHPPELNDKLDFFNVAKISDNELFLQSTDKHLSVLVAMQINTCTEYKNEIKITTSVVTYNFFGKIYMLPVSIAHGRIIRNMLKKISIIYKRNPYLICPPKTGHTV